MTANERNDKNNSNQNGKVIDIFTKQTSEDIDGAYNSMSAEQVKQIGKYIGRLPKDQAERMRKQIDEINFRHHQITHLLHEFEDLWRVYRIDVLQALNRLHVSTDYFDMDTDNLHISDEGHTYIVRDKSTSESK